MLIRRSQPLTDFSQMQEWHIASIASSSHPSGALEKPSKLLGGCVSEESKARSGGSIGTLLALYSVPMYVFPYLSSSPVNSTDIPLAHHWMRSVLMPVGFLQHPMHLCSQYMHLSIYSGVPNGMSVWQWHAQVSSACVFPYTGVFPIEWHLLCEGTVLCGCHSMGKAELSLRSVSEVQIIDCCQKRVDSNFWIQKAQGNKFGYKWRQATNFGYRWPVAYRLQVTLCLCHLSLNPTIATVTESAAFV